MLHVRSASRVFFVGLALSLLVSAAHAATIFDTGYQDSFFGPIGFDVYPDQQVGVAFSPSGNFTLDRVSVWFMSNDFDNPGRTYTLKLVTDNSGNTFTTPNIGNVLESWSMATGATGWAPLQDSADSVLHPLLNSGQVYWLVAESTEEAGLDPVWVWASNEDPLYSGSNNMNAGWEAGYSSGSTPATLIEGSPVPEPASLGLLALAGIGTLRRRRRA